jgi:hypothetical protein
MILENLESLKILENLLDNEKIKIDNIYSEYERAVRIEVSESFSVGRLEKELEKIHLKLQRSADYYNPGLKNEHKYEILPSDGQGNDTISTYVYKHKKERESFRRL